MRELIKSWKTIPSLAVLVGLFVAPLSLLFVVSFWSKKLFRVVPDFVFDGYQKALVSYWDVGLNTLAIAISTGIITTTIAFFFAFFIRFKAGRYGDILLFISLTPE